MKWLELKLDTSPAGLDPVSQLLEEQGITGLVIDDEGDFRDFLEHNHQYWDYVDEELMQEKQGLCRITFYLSDDPEGYHRLAQVRMALSQLKAAHPEYAPLLLTMNNLEDADWENNWKQFYKPMEIGGAPHCGAGVGAGQYARPHPPDPESGAHLRHRQPRHHPAVSDGAGGNHPRR